MVEGISSENLLSQLEQMQSQAAEMSGSKVPSSGKGEFQNIIGDLMNQVDSAQKQADSSLKDLATGQPNTSIQDVVLKMEQADVSFNLMVEIRNKLISAYKEILSGQT